METSVGDFMESAEGVHAMHHEHTICGDAFDIGDSTDPALALKRTKKTTVTCPRCVAIIQLCKGLRTGVFNG